MESKDSSIKDNEQEQSKLNDSINKLRNIKCSFLIPIIFEYIPKRIALGITQYNKNLQKLINVNINNYREYVKNKYLSIKLEIIPMENKYGDFIHINSRDKKYYHIYFNDNIKNEIKKTCLNERDKVSKINIIIDYKVKSFSYLFMFCSCIKSINIKNFKNNITNVSGMFFECSSLKELNLKYFNTDNVTDMRAMFSGCVSLTELNLKYFNTNKETNMSGMFCGCSSLKELNIKYFNTKNVNNMNCMFLGYSSLNKLDLNHFYTNNAIDMNWMFYERSSLKELNINNFNTKKVTNMNSMFFGCSSLKELNLNNFNTNKVIDMRGMFSKCSNELKVIIKNKYKNFKEEAFKK